jgi:Holliday junction DNA helicase RuvA
MPVTGGVEKVREASEALAVLGYSQQEIAAALKKLDLQAMTVEDIVREVLKGSLK